jgi:uncharacterized membrane protein
MGDLTHNIFPFIEKIGELIDLFGVLVIFVGAIGATVAFVYRFLKKIEPHQNYRKYRNGLARVILLGLEFLVAGDIIRSVAGEPTWNSIGILGLIVLIRSFLSIEFEMEVNGRWPWQARTRAK